MADSAFSRRLSELTGVTMFGVALLWLIALASYDSSDPAWFFNDVARGAPQNFAGRVGAFIGEASFQLVGYAAYLIPIVLCIVGWHYFWCKKIDASYTKIAGATSLVVCVAALLSLAFGALDIRTERFSGGGAVGATVAAICSAYLNRTGAAILLLTLIGLAVILSTHFSFGRAVSAIAGRLRQHRGLIERWREWKEERRRERERRQIIDKHVKKVGRDKAPEIATKVADAAEKLKAARSRSADDEDEDED